jgi:hypothetical protein
MTFKENFIESQSRKKSKGTTLNEANIVRRNRIENQLLSNRINLIQKESQCRKNSIDFTLQKTRDHLKTLKVTTGSAFDSFKNEFVGSDTDSIESQGNLTFKFLIDL